VIRANGRQYTNLKAPVPLIQINQRKDKIYNYNETAYIELTELIEYEGKWYVPDDVEDIVLKPTKMSQDLSAYVNLNSLINFSFYTDLTGLLGRRANGLLITDITSKIITNTKNIPNSDISVSSFIETSFTISKFDSKFKSMDSTDIRVGKNGQMDTIDRMKLIQTAWLKGNVKYNLFSWKTVSNRHIELNVGARINVVNCDSIFRKERDVLFFEYYPEIAYKIHKLKNFGMDFSLRWLFQRIADKEPFQNTGWETVFNPKVAFFYYPTTDPNNAIYLRFNYYAGKKKESQNFYQLQFGWKTALKFSKKE